MGLTKEKEAELLGKILYNLGMTVTMIGDEKCDDRIDRNLEWCRESLYLFEVNHTKNENRYNEIHELANISIERLKKLCR